MVRKLHLSEDGNTHIYAIKRKDQGNKYVKQFSDGYEFTTQFNWIEQYTDKKVANEDARRWSIQIQPGYYVVKLI